MPLGSEFAVSRLLPQGFSDQQIVPPRGSKYRELYVQNIVNGTAGLSDEGTYFVGTNPTPLTAIATSGSIATYAGSDTAPVAIIRNNDGLGGKRIYLDYLRMTMVVLPTTANSWTFTWTLDNLPNKYTSGGSVITPVCPNMDLGAVSIAQLYFGAITAAAKSGNARLVSYGAWKSRATTPVAVLGDEVVFKFGGVEQASSNPQIQLAAGTPVLVTKNVVGVPPIVLAPGTLAQLGMFGTNNVGTPSFEFEWGWWER